MLLDILVTVCVAAFAGLVVLGHIILLTDFWNFHRPARPPEPRSTPTHVPVE